jgi:hypothetical protein
VLVAIDLGRDAMPGQWLTVWSTSLQSADTGVGFVAEALRNETLRQFVRIPVPGEAVRIRMPKDISISGSRAQPWLCGMDIRPSSPRLCGCSRLRA